MEFSELLRVSEEYRRQRAEQYHQVGWVVEDVIGHFDVYFEDHFGSWDAASECPANVRMPLDFDEEGLPVLYGSPDEYYN